MCLVTSHFGYNSSIHLLRLKLQLQTFTFTWSALPLPLLTDCLPLAPPHPLRSPPGPRAARCYRVHNKIQEHGDKQLNSPPIS